MMIHRYAGGAYRAVRDVPLPTKPVVRRVIDNSPTRVSDGRHQQHRVLRAHPSPKLARYGLRGDALRLVLTARTQTFGSRGEETWFVGPAASGFRLMLSDLRRLGGLSKIGSSSDTDNSKCRAPAG